MYISLAYMFGPLVTRLIGRFGFRLTAIAGALLLSISFIATSFVDNFWLFFVLFSIPTGLGSAASYHSAILVVLKRFDKWRSVAVGISTSSSSVGMFVMSQITEALLSKYGLRNALRGWAFLFFLTALLACSYDSRAHIKKDKALTMEKNTKQTPADVFSPVLRNSSFMIYLTSLSLVLFVVFTPSIYMVRKVASGLRCMHSLRGLERHLYVFGLALRSQ